VPESPSKLLPSNIKAVPIYKGPAPESRWDQYDTLHVFTAKGLEYRKKVCFTFSYKKKRLEASKGQLKIFGSNMYILNSIKKNRGHTREKRIRKYLMFTKFMSWFLW
jgi:hypothetical protein